MIAAGLLILNIGTTAYSGYKVVQLAGQEERSNRENVELGLHVVCASAGAFGLAAKSIAYLSRGSLAAAQATQAAGSAAETLIAGTEAGQTFIASTSAAAAAGEIGSIICYSVEQMTVVNGLMAAKQIADIQATISSLLKVVQISEAVTLVAASSSGAMQLHATLDDAEKRAAIEQRLPEINAATQSDPLRWELAYPLIPEQYGPNHDLSIENRVFAAYTWTPPGFDEPRPIRFPVRIDLGAGERLYEYGFVRLCFENALIRDLEPGQQRPTAAAVQAQVAALWKNVEVAALDRIETEIGRIERQHGNN